VKRLLLLLLVLAIPTPAQETLEQKAERLRRDFSRPAAEWDDTFVVSTFEKYLNLYLDLLWDPSFYPRVAVHLPKNRPKIRVLVAGEFRTPYMRSEEMIVPVECLRYLAAIGFLVGHDAYVEDHLINLPYPLLSGPYRSSAIIPLLQPLADSIDVEAFMALQPYLICPAKDTSCATVQNQAVVGLFLFAILHELSHEVLHHKVSEEGVNLEHELAADKNAHAVLSLFAEEFKALPDDLKKATRFAIEVAPVMFLEAESSRVGPVTAFSKQREDALIKTFPQNMQVDIALFIEPARSERNIEHLTIDWTEEPAVLLIDGVAVDTSEVRQKVLTLNGGRHTILGVRPDSISGVQVEIETGDKTVQVHLKFRPFSPADQRVIDEARKKRKWLEVLLQTTDGSLGPKDAVLALDHFEALHRLGLDKYIKVDDWTVIPKEDWAKVARWQRSREPLSSWY
jgi:hypothetical protein